MVSEGNVFGDLSDYGNVNIVIADVVGFVNSLYIICRVLIRR